MTRMPDSYYKALEWKLGMLLTELTGTIFSSKEFLQIQEFIDVGEYGLAFETLCGTITVGNYIIPKPSHEKIIELGQLMNIDKKFYESITAI